jgi:hypothetical protein
MTDSHLFAAVDLAAAPFLLTSYFKFGAHEMKGQSREFLGVSAGQRHGRIVFMSKEE